MRCRRAQYEFSVATTPPCYTLLSVFYSNDYYYFITKASHLFKPARIHSLWMLSILARARERQWEKTSMTTVQKPRNSLFYWFYLKIRIKNYDYYFSHWGRARFLRSLGTTAKSRAGETNRVKIDERCVCRNSPTSKSASIRDLFNR